MSLDPGQSVRVRGLGKRYRIGRQRSTRYGSLRDDLTDLVSSRLRGRGRSSTADRRVASERDFWALREIDLEIAMGDRLGVIGRNGAGKSTLLKLLSRITSPTTGEIALRGRLASLLEVGTGFHPEMSGRENIYLNGMLLGMQRREVRARFDEIVDFAGVEAFLDTPVKRYSSGMYVRLAFAVAAHLDPDILIVDEVLAVGDAEFQAKCLGKMSDVSRDGRTLIFVSHNLLAVGELCNRVALLDAGTLVRCGEARPVIAEYNDRVGQSSSDRSWAAFEEAPGSDEVRLKQVAVRASGCAAATPLSISDELSVRCDFWLRSTSTLPTVCFSLHNQHGILVFDLCSPANLDVRQVAPVDGGLVAVSCRIPADFLNDGGYGVSVKIVHDKELVVDVEDACRFTLQDSSELRDGWLGDDWPGVMRPRLQWWARSV